jgi:flagellar protein FliO/FliZ
LPVRSIFGLEIPQGVQWLLALALVLGMVVVVGWLLRRFAGGKLRSKNQGNRARQPRLGIVDIYDMDRQRQLILLRRDNVEHLVMIGGPNDVVVETMIVRAGSRATLSSLTPEAPEPAVEPLPTAKETAPVKEITREPVVQPLRNTATFVTASAAGAIAAAGAVTAKALEPSLGKTETLPAPVTAVKIQPSIQDPVLEKADLSAIETPLTEKTIKPFTKPEIEAELPQTVEKPAQITRTAITAPQTVSSELDDMTRELEEALKRPFAVVPPQMTALPDKKPTVAALQEIQPAVAVTPPVQSIAIEATKPIATQQAETAFAEALEASVSIPVVTNQVKSDTLAGVLSSTVQPAKGVTTPESSATKALKDLEALVDKPKNEIQPPAPAELKAKKPAAEPAATSAKLGNTDIHPAPKPINNAMPENKSSATPASAKALADPFSAEAIEAEFARLLGRNTETKT